MQAKRKESDESIPLEIVKITLIHKNNDIHVNSSKHLEQYNPFTNQARAGSPSKLKKQATAIEDKQPNKYRQLFNLKKEVVFKELPNVVGKNVKGSPKKVVIMSKLINKNYNSRIGSQSNTHKSKKSKGKSNTNNSSKADTYNRKVREQNLNFTSKLREKLQYDHYEESSGATYSPKSDSMGFDVSSKRRYKVERRRESEGLEGQLITLNLDMGHRGVYVLHGLDTQDPRDIAMDFCQKHLFGPRTASQVAVLVADKIKQFSEYKGHELKDEYKNER